jgi:hypothetical protein
MEELRHSGWELDDDPLLLAAACYPAAVADLVSVLSAFNRRLYSAALRIDNPATHNSSSSSSSTSQAAAGAAMLAVVLSRSLVQLADAMEAAGPQVLFSCLRLEPAFNVVWSPEGQEYAPQQVEIVAPGSAAHQNVGSQWQDWQLTVLGAMQPLMSAMAALGMADLAGDAIFGNNRATAAAAAGPDVTASSSTSGQASNTSSSSRPKWGHLLHLQQFSPDWPASVEAFWDRRPYWSEDALGLLWASTPNILHEVQLQFDNALQLTRELVDAAPLPVVCNNPSCESLAGVSEAAASCKACSECRCRYCSEACQQADWKRHKPVCKRMVAAGMTCA